MMDRPFVIALRSQFLAAAALFGAAGAVGCHREVVPVSGRVTLDGKPLANAVVTFQPLGQGKAMTTMTTGSAGKTDSNGRFRLRLVSPDRNGAAIGDHFVTISAPPGEIGGAPTSDDLIPLVWRDGSRQFRVPARGTREANFDIKSEPPASDDAGKDVPGKKRRGR